MGHIIPLITSIAINIFLVFMSCIYYVNDSLYYFVLFDLQRYNIFPT